LKVPQPEFTDWFKDRLQELHLTHAGFAERSGLSLSTVNNLKNYGDGYSRHTIRRVLRTLGIKMSMQEFLELLASETESSVTKPRHHNWSSRMSGQILVIALGLIILLGILGATFVFFTTEESSVKFVALTQDQKGILLYPDEAGRPPFQIPVGNEILEPLQVRVGKERQIVTATSGREARRYAPGTLLVYDSTGTERWSYALRDTAFLNFPEPYYNRASVSDFFRAVRVGKGRFFPDQPDEQVWVFANDGIYAVSHFTILDLVEKRPLYSLWNWGRIFPEILIRDFDQDGFHEVAVITMNNNLGKMVCKALGKTTDFYFSFVVLFEPIQNRTNCVPGFFYRPECSTESVKWMATVPPHDKRVANIGFEHFGGADVIRIHSQLPFIYYVKPDGEFFDVFANNEWTAKHGNHTPALVMFRMTSKEVKKEIIPTCDDGRNHFDLIYTDTEIKELMTLIEISIPLNDQLPSYYFNGQKILEVGQ